MKVQIILKWFTGLFLLAGVIYYFSRKKKEVTEVTIKEKDSPGIRKIFNQIFNPTSVNATTVAKSDLVKPPQASTLVAKSISEPSFKIASFLEPAKIVISQEGQRTFEPPLQVKTLPNPVVETVKYVTPGKSTPIVVPKVVYPGRSMAREVVATNVLVGGKAGLQNLVRSK